MASRVPEQGAEQGQPARENDRLHALSSPCSSLGTDRLGPAARAAATVSKAKPRDALTRTTSPAARPASTRRTASSRSVATSARTPLRSPQRTGHHLLGEVPERHDPGDPPVGRVRPQRRGAPRRRPRTQLEHVAQHRPAAAPGRSRQHAGHGVEGGAHRLRVGVVGVVDDQHAVVPLGQLHPPPRTRPSGGQGGHDRLPCSPEGPGQCRRRHRVGHLVPARQTEPDPDRARSAHRRTSRAG